MKIYIYVLFFRFVSKFFSVFCISESILSKDICCIIKLIAIKEMEWGLMSMIWGDKMKNENEKDTEAISYSFVLFLSQWA